MYMSLCKGTYLLGYMYTHTSTHTCDCDDAPAVLLTAADVTSCAAERAAADIGLCDAWLNGGVACVCDVAWA